MAFSLGFDFAYPWQPRYPPHFLTDRKLCAPSLRMVYLFQLYFNLNCQSSLFTSNQSITHNFPLSRASGTMSIKIENETLFKQLKLKMIHPVFELYLEKKGGYKYGSNTQKFFNRTGQRFIQALHG